VLAQIVKRRPLGIIKVFLAERPRYLHPVSPQALTGVRKAELL
jgi:hypothetical protein